MRDDLFIESLDQLDEKELLRCLQAAKLADAKAPVEVSLEEAEKFVRKSVPAKVVKMKVSWIVGVISVAAAIALAVVLFVRNPGEDIAPAIADEVAPGQEVVEQPAIEEILEEKEVAPVENEIKNDKKAVKTAKSDVDAVAPAKGAIPVEVSREDSSHASSAEMSLFKLISPSKDLYRIRVVDESKSFPFQWNPEGIEGARLILQDKSGNIFLQKDFTTEDHFDLLASDVLPYGDVVWSFFVQFESGKEARNSGMISFVKAE